MSKEKEHYINKERNLGELFEQPALKHNYYKYYSAYDRISHIISDGYLYLSNGDSWNDKEDGRNFKSYGNCYGMCFSYQKMESIAMWMLYGDQCRGLMIDFTPNQISRIIEHNSTKPLILGTFDNNVFIARSSCLSKKIEIVDIFYETINSQGRCFYRGNDCYSIHSDMEQKILKKHYAWKYENECRLVVSFEDSIPRIQKGFVQLEIPEEVKSEIPSRTYKGPSNLSNNFRTSALEGCVRWNIS